MEGERGRGRKREQPPRRTQKNVGGNLEKFSPAVGPQVNTMGNDTSENWSPACSTNFWQAEDRTRTGQGGKTVGAWDYNVANQTGGGRVE